MTTAGLSASLRAVTIAVVGLLAVSAFAQGPSSGYRVVPSENGEAYKTLVVDVFGFSIDVPSSWRFGSHGAPPLTVILAFPEGMNTATFHDGFRMLEIGTLPSPPMPMPLSEAFGYIRQGLLTVHASAREVEPVETLTVGGNDALRWTFAWSSKTGNTVYERITMIAYGDSIRSVAYREATKGDQAPVDMGDELVATYRAFDPVL